MTASDPSSDPLHAGHAAPDDAAIGRALALVRFLRERCPWDARQDPHSLRPYLLEEAHEVAEAIAAGDEPGLRDELGDLLLNLAFQIVLAEERQAFDGAAVVEGMEAKMRARHPHIYGGADTPADWEALKARERAHAAAERGTGEPAGDGEERGPAEAEGAPPDPFHGVPHGLEPLSRALRVQDRMAALGFDWPDASGPLAKVREETDEVEARLGTGEPGADALREELGDLLFAVVNLARLARVHPSDALVRATRKFEARSRAIRRLAAERGLDWEAADLEALDALWDEVKATDESADS